MFLNNHTIYIIHIHIDTQVNRYIILLFRGIGTYMYTQHNSTYVH